MATTAASAKDSKGVKVSVFSWEGKDRSGKHVKGEMRASGMNIVTATLRRQGIANPKVKKQSRGGGKKIKLWLQIYFRDKQVAVERCASKQVPSHAIAEHTAKRNVGGCAGEETSIEVGDFSACAIG